MAATLADILSESTRRLESITETPRLEAELLLAHAMNLSRASLLARLREPFDVPGFFPLLERRLQFEPLAYIFGSWEFYGLSMLVAPPLLTPRPETEHLVECALNFLIKRGHPSVIADICCGTGCVGVAIAHHVPEDLVYATDTRLDAAMLTQRNAARHHGAVHAIQGNLLDPFSDMEPCFDLIVSNPPYVPESEWNGLSPVITRHEDPGALLAGHDGLDVVRRLVPQALPRLREGGMLALEIGEDQYATVETILCSLGYRDVKATRDLGGIQRIISGIKS